MILFCQQKDAFYVLSLSALGTERERKREREIPKDMQGNISVPNTERRDVLFFKLKYSWLVHETSYKDVLASSLESSKQIVGLQDEFWLHIRFQSKLGKF